MDRGAWQATVPGITKRHDWVTSLSGLFLSGFSFLSVWPAQPVGSYFPDYESNPHPLQGKHGVLITGPPGECITSIFISSFKVVGITVFETEMMMTLPWAKKYLPKFRYAQAFLIQQRYASTIKGNWEEIMAYRSYDLLLENVYIPMPLFNKHL